LEAVFTVGLSPRTRGNPGRPSGRWSPYGSIPAHAGEPNSGGRERRGCRVYPRARGGTLEMGRPSPFRDGLSPRTRGNRTRETCVRKKTGSIPAHAGEPDRVVGV